MKARQDHQWADVNGDGLVDFLWVDKFSGDTSVRKTHILKINSHN